MSRSQDGPPPLANPDAEAGLVAAVLAGDVSALSLAEPGDFWDTQLAAIWDAARAVRARGVEPRMLAVADELERRGQLTAVGGQARLAEITDGCENLADGASYAALVRDYAGRRLVERAITDLGASLHRDGDFAEARRRLREVLDQVETREGGIYPARSADEVAALYGSVRWAWPGWIPAGHLSLIVGQPGVGKSFFAARLIASLAGCAPWPDGAALDPSAPGLPARTLLVETESFAGEYVKRLDGLGVGRHWYSFAGDDDRAVNLARDIPAIERLAVAEGFGAVVVDSLAGSHRLEERDDRIRAILQALAAMGARLGIPVIAVHHLRKRNIFETAGVSLDRVRGSSVIVQFARAVVALWRPGEREAEGAVRVEVIKSNFARPPQPCGFTVTDDRLEVCAAPEPPRVETQQDRAADLLLARLRPGPVRVKELREEMEDAGLSWPTAERAKDRLGIVLVRRSDG